MVVIPDCSNQGKSGAYSAFVGHSRVATGALIDVALVAKASLAHAGDAAQAAVLIFDNVNCEAVEVDWRGPMRTFKLRVKALDDARAVSLIAESVAIAPSSSHTRGPGRPKLGVVAREVTLLPRHWDWLASQPGGASVVLRKLVDAARRATESQDRVRKVRAAAYRFMSTLMGNAAGFEEACRALFAGDKAAFDTHTADWPADVRLHLSAMLAGSFSGQNEQQQDE